MYTTPGSLTDKAYADVKRRLLDGEFPLNVRLAEERLGALLGISRTPVREALVRLHAEGLVDRLPEGGYTPARPQLERMSELYEVRRGLELQAIRRTSGRTRTHDRSALQSLLDDWVALAQETPDADPSFVLTDEDFHVRLALAAGNQSLAEMLTTVNERIRLIRMQDFVADERVKATIEQHIGIVDAMLGRKPAVAERLLEEHLAESMSIVESRAARALARMVGLTRE